MTQPDCAQCTAVADRPALRDAATQAAEHFPVGATPDATLAATLRTWHRRGHPTALLAAIEGASP